MCKPLPEDKKQLTREFTLRRKSKNDSEGHNDNIEEVSVDKQMEDKIMDTGRLFIFLIFHNLILRFISTKPAFFLH